MKPVIQNSQVTVRQLDHPVRHNLARDMNPVSLEFLADPVQWKTIGIFRIHDAGTKGRGNDAVAQQALRTVRLHNGLIIFSCINSHLMDFYCIDGRLHPDPFIGFIRKLLPPASAKNPGQLFF